MLLILVLLASNAIIAQNMSRYITLTIKSGQNIKFSMAADADGTTVKIVSGSQTYNTTVGTSWTATQNYQSDGTTMTIYGDIKRFKCSENYANLTGLDVSHNTNLTYLSCNHNELTSLDVSHNTSLIEFWCTNNELTNLDVSQNINLEKFCCSVNKLSSLDISHNTNLNSIDCSHNQLSSLDVSHNTSLNSIDCSKNQLSNLDVSNNTNLMHLFCNNNQLTSLDVSNNTVLMGLECSENQLISLNVSHNSTNLLTHLHCSDNQLTSLDISANTNLEVLDCSENQLTSLDVSNNTNLRRLWCYKNQFSTQAIDDIFCSLPSRNVSDNAKIYILQDNSGTDYDAVIASNKQNAMDKNWNVMYANGIDFIPPTTGTYDCNNVAVTGVSLNHTTQTIVAGTDFTLTATVTPDNATNKNVTWSSSNSSM